MPLMSFVYLLFSSPEPLGSQGELIVYHGPSFNNFKDLLLGNHLANQSKILSEASIRRGNESVKNNLGHTTRWPPCPFMVKTFKTLLFQNPKSYDLETWYVALGCQAPQCIYINHDPMMTLTYFTTRST